MAPKRKQEGSLNTAYGVYNEKGDAIPQSDLPRKEKLSEDLTFISWNVGSLRSLLAKKPELLLNLWNQERPAVLGLMETKIGPKEEESVTNDIRKLLGCETGLTLKSTSKKVKLIFNHSTSKKGYSGTLMIIDEFQTGAVSDPVFKIGTKPADDEGRVIAISLPSLSISVTLCYSPNSGQTLERLSYRTETFDKCLSEFCRDLKDSKQFPVLLMGDLNVAVDDEDIWNVDAAHIPKSAGTTPAERESFRREFLDKGFHDTFKKPGNLNSGWFSYWSVRAGNKPKNRGLRLDYVLALGADDRISEGFILPDFAPNGDHAPVGVLVRK